MRQEFYAMTPNKGIVLHGFFVDNEIFERKVGEKDRMKIFDAWALNADVMDRLKDRLKLLRYFNRDDNMIYEISFEEAKKHGFEKTFAGGRTFYIPIKYWKKYENQRKQTK